MGLGEFQKQPITGYISTVYPILQQILYNVVVYRMINVRLQPSDDALIENLYQRDFWINTSNNAIQMAIIDWCKVFGSERDNPFHCGKHGDFAVDEQICTAITRFRNKYIAHKTDVEVPVPKLDGAMEVIYDFDKKIREEYDLDGYQNLEGWYETYTIRIEDLMEQYNFTEF